MSATTGTTASSAGAQKRPETLSRHSQCPLHGSCARTWTGTARRIENSQVAVHLATSRRREYAAIDRELCAPRSWITDAVGCRLAGIPKGVGFADYGLITADRLLRTRGNAQTSAHSTSGSSAHDRGSRAPGALGLHAEPHRRALLSCTPG
ncbi:transposase [Streptomyces sp. NPDC008240]|uniref:transposase n=1 Tax=Streptomyces sp. NPDC008240 TaxID=3364822 RepID=UPI0036F0A6EE